jgi:hypothetical protein
MANPKIILIVSPLPPLGERVRGAYYQEHYLDSFFPSPLRWERVSVRQSNLPPSGNYLKFPLFFKGG